MTMIKYKKLYKPRFGGVVLIAVALGCMSSSALAASESVGSEWPHRISVNNAAVSVYKPQIEAYGKKVATARAAFSVSPPGEGPQFGAVRFSAVVIQDAKSGLAKFSDIGIIQVKLPPGKSERFRSAFKAAFSKAQFAMTLAQFEANRDTTGDPKGDRGFENAPPTIFYETVPAVLVLIDGDPILEEVEDGYYKYVVNTAYFIVLNPDDNYFYLKGGRWWYRTKDLGKAWRQVDRVPKPIAKLAKEAFTGDASDPDTTIASMSAPPKIIVSTQPAELIVINGAPNLVSVQGTSLLYVDNTEDDVLFDIRTQTYYTLMSGRWYATKSLENGPWKFVRSDRLPNDFARIPPDSAIASVRVAVAGTREAEDAVLETSIPQTAEISRQTATVDVTYDGVPKFQRIRGTQVYYALNSNKVVLRIHGRYHAIDNGVWFESPEASGPWVVSVVVPPEVYDIPPSAPVYHVRYVYIYDHTPDVVYVGYTPGYYCTYVYHGTVIYGTGYYYRPWYRVHYYPHPVTFGFGIHYNPYTGWWGYPVGVSYGWISFGWFPFPYAYWGPSGYIYGYRHGYYHHHHHDYYHGYRNGYRHGFAAGRSAGYRAAAPSIRPARPTAGNVYEYRRDGVQRTHSRITDINRSAVSRSRSASIRGARPDLSGRSTATRDHRSFTRRKARATGDRSRPIISRPDRQSPLSRTRDTKRVRTPENRSQRPAVTRSRKATERPFIQAPSKQTNRALPSATPNRNYTKQPPPKVYQPPKAKDDDDSSPSVKRFKSNSTTNRFKSSHSRPNRSSIRSKSNGSNTNRIRRSMKKHK